MHARKQEGWGWGAGAGERRRRRNVRSKPPQARACPGSAAAAACSLPPLPSSGARPQPKMPHNDKSMCAVGSYIVGGDWAFLQEARGGLDGVAQCQHGAQSHHPSWKSKKLLSMSPGLRATRVPTT
eukprot:COSAG02_NODE_35322_length_470_cov_0.832884_1_plen_125_part_01